MIFILQMKKLKLTVIKNYLPEVKELHKGTNWGLMPEMLEYLYLLYYKCIYKFLLLIRYLSTPVTL